MEFKYTASTVEGGLINGVVEAESETTAEDILWKSGLTIIDLKKSLKVPALHQMLPSLFGVKKRDVITFSRNLASLLDAGIPILRALAIQSRFGRASLRAVLREVMKDLERGMRLSEAFAKYPKVFPNFYVYLIKTGEEVGNLSGVLKDIAIHMERDEATAKKIKGSLAYPAFVMLLAVGAIFVMLTFVVPALTSMFKEFGSELPPMTRALMAVGDFFSSNFLYMILAVVLIVIAFVLYTRTPSGKKNKDRFILKIPVIGGATLKGNLARFTRNMGMLVAAGVSLFDALKLASETTDNLVVADAVSNVRSNVSDGKLFSQAVAADPLFPSLMSEMIGVGEESGSLESHLLKVSAFYEEESERAISQVTGMLTPALTIGVGLIIGLIAVTIFSSIYSLVGALPDTS
jgi:type IV pilus assembly protein PilC